MIPFYALAETDKASTFLKISFARTFPWLSIRFLFPSGKNHPKYYNTLKPCRILFKYIKRSQ